MYHGLIQVVKRLIPWYTANFPQGQPVFLLCHVEQTKANNLDIKIKYEQEIEKCKRDFEEKECDFLENTVEYEVGLKKNNFFSHLKFVLLITKHSHYAILNSQILNHHR